MAQIVNGRYDWKTKISSTLEGYEKIIIHPGLPFENLSPYAIVDAEGILLENAWQFSKIYKYIHPQKQMSYISGIRGKLLIWDHPAEIHVDEKGVPTKDYWKWREKGFSNKYAIRFPNGYTGAKEALGSFHLMEDGWYYLLDYIDARKKIYCNRYIDALVNKNCLPATLSEFESLKKRVRRGEKLLIIEVDGPTHGKSTPYNKIVKSHKLGDEGVDVMDATKENIVDALNNPERSFGHGYCVSTLIQNKKEWLK